MMKVVQTGAVGPDGKPVLKPVYSCDHDGCKDVANFHDGKRHYCPHHYMTMVVKADHAIGKSK